MKIRIEIEEDELEALRNTCEKEPQCHGCPKIKDCGLICADLTNNDDPCLWTNEDIANIKKRIEEVNNGQD